MLSLADMHHFCCSQLVVCILFAVFIQVSAHELGEECTDSSNLKGTCKFLIDCPHVLMLKSNNRRYNRCGFNGVREIVCCAQRDITRGPVKSDIPDRRHVRECEQYKSTAFDIENLFTPLTANAHTIKKTVSKCSRNTFPLVVSGENANPKEFPHMALLGCKDTKGKIDWICGGTLISPNFVLTAAHCFEDVQCGEVNTVRLGDLDIDSNADDAQPKDFEIEKTIIHPEYNETIKYNDIALLKLKTRVQITPYIRPACLPFQQYSNVSQLIITGWGAKEFAHSFTSHLQKATVELFEQAECNEVYTEEGSDKWPVGVRERTQICAGPKTGRRDTCQGDSGGPLQIIHPIYPCMYTVVGITSTGQACGIESVPAVYTRVFFYIDWIESVVWE